MQLIFWAAVALVAETPQQVKLPEQGSEAAIVPVTRAPTFRELDDTMNDYKREDTLIQLNREWIVGRVKLVPYGDRRAAKSLLGVRVRFAF